MTTWEEVYRWELLLARDLDEEQFEALKDLTELLHSLVDDIEFLHSEVARLTVLPPRQCSNCDAEFVPKNAQIRWCPRCARAGKAAVEMGWKPGWSPYHE